MSADWSRCVTTTTQSRLRLPGTTAVDKINKQVDSLLVVGVCLSNILPTKPSPPTDEPRQRTETRSTLSHSVTDIICLDKYCHCCGTQNNNFILYVIRVRDEPRQRTETRSTLDEPRQRTETGSTLNHTSVTDIICLDKYCHCWWYIVRDRQQTLLFILYVIRVKRRAEAANRDPLHPVTLLSLTLSVWTSTVIAGGTSLEIGRRHYCSYFTDEPRQRTETGSTLNHTSVTDIICLDKYCHCWWYIVRDRPQTLLFILYVIRVKRRPETANRDPLQPVTLLSLTLSVWTTTVIAGYIVRDRPQTLLFILYLIRVKRRAEAANRDPLHPVTLLSLTLSV
ncbi:hypothetical protein J6590_042478 [Homalodisca vitripennis]|nr:hypothetical protein J6590_042478 [Homalodisca vitripennis]